MGRNHGTEKVTFQVTVCRSNLSSPHPKQDYRVTVTIGDESKITCSGDLSDDGLTITWDHPFLFTALPSAIVKVAICALPELCPGWEIQPLGDQMVTNVTKLLESGDEWQCDVPGLVDGPGTLTMICAVHDKLYVPNGHDCLSALVDDYNQLDDFTEQSRNMPCLCTLIQLAGSLLDLHPLGHEDHPLVLHNLANSFQHQYDQGGNISDLHRAIAIYQIELDLCPTGHPDHAAILESLATALTKLFGIQRNGADLERVIEMQERRLGLCPGGHSDYVNALGRLSESLYYHFAMQGCIADLDRAIDLEKKRYVIGANDDFYYGEAMRSLAVSLGSCYNKQDDIVYLEKATDLLEKKLEYHGPNHPMHGNTLYHLALSLQDLFIATNDICNQIRAIHLFKTSLATFPPQHCDFAFVAGALAKATLLLFKEHQSSPLQDDAFEAYKQLKKCSPAVSLDLLEAAQAWIEDAEKYSHPSVLEAHQLLFNTLDHFTSLNASLDSRHLTIQARVAPNLPTNDAFTCAVRLSDYKMAVKLLEQGRGILWNQLARFDISLAELESQSDRGSELRNEFTRLSTDLKEHAQGSGGKDPYWQVQEQWQSVVDEIRTLEGFSRFLLPPLFEDLRRAAELGPVIIVNVGQEASNALIVHHSGSPVHVMLPCSFTDVDQLCSQLSELTLDAHAYGKNREFYVKEFLRELWSTVVEPISTVLQDDIQLPLGSRIWWCPMSKFTRLPFHAAGPHRQAKKNMFDLYVSSYAPSLSALIRAQDRIRSQRAARSSASGGANPISFAAIGQGRPSALTKLSELPEVARELCEIQNETGMPADVVAFNTVTGDAATIKGAVEAFRDHRWVHLACHGAQHADKPFESWFAMGDGKLTLMRILQERYTNSEFAFLSACHTAVGDASTPDEVLHLAAGMQFAGFNGVIGTLWRVDDAVAHQVVTEFYKEMLKQPVIGFEHAAAALNTAVLKTAGQVSLEKRIVFVHIGI